jgi:hypothetical protein
MLLLMLFSFVLYAGLYDVALGDGASDKICAEGQDHASLSAMCRRVSILLSARQFSFTYIHVFM